MEPAPPPILSGEEKLHALRFLDHYRYWHSLDDRRYCRVCDREITGHQVIVVKSKATPGAMRLQCPTAGCSSTVGNWIYANPVLAARSKWDTDAGRRG